MKFTAEWCSSCRVLAPIVEGVARDYAGKLKVLEMDADTNISTQARCGVRSMPTILLFRDGELADRIIGAVPDRVLRERVDRLVEKTVF